MKTVRLVIIFWLMVFGLNACSIESNHHQSPAAYVDLSVLEPLPTLHREVPPLRVAVASVVSPKGTVQSYNDLLQYLSIQFNRPVELVQRRTYAETNQLIAEGRVDVAFVCTSAYLEGSQTFGMELLVAPQVGGDTVYYSLLLVPFESSAQSMADLQNRVFAFTDPISLSGRVYPTMLVRQLGYEPEKFFSRIFFTYNHDEAIRAVASGLADGASVDSLVYEFAVQRDPALQEKVRVIHRSPPFGIPPVVVGPQVDDNLKRELQKVLLNMAFDPQGQQALSEIGVERFVNIEEEAYEGARQLVQQYHLEDDSGSD
ncbi:MAG: phosphonate ABC transporter substrate-binding protein [Bellilinea sp.]|nr:MAG: phosphonate ABC transporter substrate-binding protein [Bellilinea sp.]